jgi:hypothetical protein
MSPIIRGLRPRLLTGAPLGRDWSGVGCENLISHAARARFLSRTPRGGNRGSCEIPAARARFLSRTPRGRLVRDCGSCEIPISHAARRESLPAHRQLAGDDSRYGGAVRPAPCQRTIISAIRSAARPSHSSGTRGVTFPACTRRYPAKIRSGDMPTTWLVPCSAVTGRSALNRDSHEWHLDSL